MEVIKFDKIENKIIELRTTQIILDSDVAELYGVQTKNINRAVSNNPDKFPDGYLFELNSEEKQEVVKKFNHLEKLKFSPYLPKAFTERGLYMLATILKSEQATQTTLETIDTFYKIKTLSRTDKVEQKSLMQRGGELIAEILDDDLITYVEDRVPIPSLTFIKSVFKKTYVAILINRYSNQNISAIFQ